MRGSDSLFIGKNHPSHSFLEGLYEGGKSKDVSYFILMLSLNRRSVNRSGWWFTNAFKVLLIRMFSDLVIKIVLQQKVISKLVFNNDISQKFRIDNQINKKQVFLHGWLWDMICFWQKVDVNPKLAEGMSGQVWCDDAVVLPGE